MADNNVLSLTNFTSKTLGTFLHKMCPFLGTSYRGVEEFVNHPGYGVSDVVNIKKPGYPTVQRGVAVTAEDIIDEVAAYVLSENDIYNVTYNVNIKKLNMQFVGGQVCLSGDPNIDPNDDKLANPQARTLIDNYVYPAAISIISDVEKELATKARNAAFYTPIDTPAKLGAVNSYSSVSSVEALMDDLGFMNNRIGVMNVRDAKQVADSLQNMFNESFNINITKNARIGGPDKGRLAGLDIFRTNGGTLVDTPECPQFAVNPNITVASVSADGSQITFSGVDTVTSVLITAGTMISIPSVQLLSQASKVVLNTKLVVTSKFDASGDGAGNVTITLDEPLVATGMQANVDSIPAASAAAEIFPGHKNNIFYVPMGIIANPIPLAEIVGADNKRYHVAAENIDVMCYVQGLATSGLNTYRMSTMIPTLGIGRYLINLPSSF